LQEPPSYQWAICSEAYISVLKVYERSTTNR